MDNAYTKITRPENLLCLEPLADRVIVHVSGNGFQGILVKIIQNLDFLPVAEMDD